MAMAGLLPLLLLAALLRNGIIAGGSQRYPRPLDATAIMYSGADLPYILRNTVAEVVLLLNDVVLEEQHWPEGAGPVQLSRNLTIDGTQGQGSGEGQRPVFDMNFVAGKVGRATSDQGWSCCTNCSAHMPTIKVYGCAICPFLQSGVVSRYLVC